MTTNTNPEISVPAFATTDLASVKTTLDGIDVSAQKVSTSLSKAFSNAIVGGRTFNSTLQTLALSLSKMMLNSALQPLSNGLMQMASNAFSGTSGTTPTIAPFADGGIVASPTFFGSGSSMGLMGERGAEAIVPLSRGPDGRLGIAAQGGGKSTSVVVNIATTDAESFRKSEGQISSALARAVARGQRSL